MHIYHLVHFCLSISYQNEEIKEENYRYNLKMSGFWNLRHFEEKRNNHIHRFSTVSTSPWSPHYSQEPWQLPLITSTEPFIPSLYHNCVPSVTPQQLPLLKSTPSESRMPGRIYRCYFTNKLPHPDQVFLFYYLFKRCMLYKVSIYSESDRNVSIHFKSGRLSVRRSYMAVFNNF